MQISTHWVGSRTPEAVANEVKLVMDPSADPYELTPAESELLRFGAC